MRKIRSDSDANPAGAFLLSRLNLPRGLWSTLRGVVIVRSNAVKLEKDSHIEYKNFSPNLARGVCKGCARPVVSILTNGAFFENCLYTESQFAAHL